MKISMFIHIYGDRIWNALTKEFLNLTEEEINFIKKYQKQIIKEDVKIPNNLILKHVVVTCEEEKQIIEYLKKITRDYQFQSLYLIVSTACNLDCDYCFYRSSASSSLKSRQNMEFEVAKKALLDFKKIVENNIKDKDYWQQITFYGGEPLLNKKMLYQTLPFTRNLFPNSTNLVINTNATLLENNDIKIFKDNDVEVQVSLDGDKEKHNLHRKNHFGEGTYEVVIRNIKKLLDSGIKVLPMITATDDNLEGFSDRLYSIVKELGINDFAVNILITNSFKTSEEYAEQLAEEMLMAYKKFGDIASDYAFVELYRRLKGDDKTIAKGACGSSRKITIFPNGKIYACQALEKVKQNFIGNLKEDYISSPTWECWRERSRFNNNECLSCAALLSCGGGCATGSYNMNGSIYDIDKNNCEYTKKLFKKIHKI